MTFTEWKNLQVLVPQILDECHGNL
jgi:hypothetical protein